MTVQEAKQSLEEIRAQLKAKGVAEEEIPEEIVRTFYAMFQKDEIDVNEFGDLCQLVGYELTEDFKNMSPEDQKTKGLVEDEEDAEDLSEEEIEDAKEVEEDEVDDKSEDEEESDDEKAKRLFGFKK